MLCLVLYHLCKTCSPVHDSLLKYNSSNNNRSTSRSIYNRNMLLLLLSKVGVCMQVSVSVPMYLLAAFSGSTTIL